MDDLLKRKVMVWYNVYDGEGEGEDPSADDPKDQPADDSKDQPADKDKDKTFTQRELNTILKKEREAHQSKVKAALDELEAIKTKATLTEEERKQLEERTTQLRRDLMTKEQIAAEKRKQLETEYQKKLEDATKERDAWKDRYTNTVITDSLRKAAVDNKAYNADQIIGLLRGNTRLTEELDNDGKPTGNLIAKVQLTEVQDGKVVTLDLAPNDAVKRLSEKEDFMNLFKDDGKGGLGYRTRSTTIPVDIKEIMKDPAKYRAHRDQLFK